jgi:histidinol-phosphate/aromatic aminotransferase/cobyric acid decarboxylase-like protein
MSDVFVSRHGGFVHHELAALGASASDVLDASVNVNPYGPCAELRDAIQGAAIDRYPDPEAAPARQALSAWLGLPAKAFVAGNGAVDVLWAAARAFVKPGDRVLVAEPAFSEFRRAAVREGALIVEHRARPEDDFAFDADGFRRALSVARPRIAHVATPSNPAGRWVPFKTLSSIAADHPKTLFVFDVSFVTLADPTEPLARLRDFALPNVLWVMSLTKELSIPGIRVGFGATERALAAELQARLPPWSVNAPAQAAIEVATRPSIRRFVEASRRALAADRGRLAQGLAALGLRVHRSEAPYVLVGLAGTGVSATELRRRAFVNHRVLLRDATSFGLPEHVRIAARPAPDDDRILHALRTELR